MHISFRKVNIFETKLFIVNRTACQVTLATELTNIKTKQEGLSSLKDNYFESLKIVYKNVQRYIK